MYDSTLYEEHQVILDHLWSMIRKRRYLSKYIPLSGGNKTHLNRLLRLYKQDYKLYSMKKPGLIKLPTPDYDNILELEIRGYFLIPLKPAKSQHLRSRLNPSRKFACLLFSYSDTKLNGKELSDEENFLLDEPYEEDYLPNYEKPDKITGALTEYEIKQILKSEENNYALAARYNVQGYTIKKLREKHGIVIAKKPVGRPSWGWGISEIKRNRILKDKRPYAQIAREEGVSGATIWALHKKFGVKKNTRYLTDDEIREIRNSNESPAVLANRYGRKALATITKIKQRQIYKHVQGLSPKQQEEKSIATIGQERGIPYGKMKRALCNNGIKRKRGRKIGQKSLTNDIVKAIRESNESNETLTMKFGVSSVSIHNIRKKKWHRNVK